MLATALGVALRWVIDPWLGSELPLVTSFAAVAAVACLTGRGPAILATVGGYLASDLLYLEPRGVLGPADLSHVFRLLAYLLSCSLIMIAAEAFRRYRSDSVERQKLLNVTLASIGDAVVTTDLRGRVTNLNPVAVSLTGWPVAEAIGKPLETIFRALDEQTRRPIDNPALRALREGGIVGLANHTVLIAKDGFERAIDDSAAPIVGDDGKVEGCVLVFRDVTEQRRAQQAVARNERQLADFFENAPMAMHWVGADGVVLRANQAELDLLGYGREEFVGRPIADFHVDRPVIEEVLEDLRAGKSVIDRPARLRCKDGSVRDVIIHASPLIENGVFLHSRCLTVDVTGPKLAQESQARLAAIVADSDDAIVSKTLEGVIQSWNEGAERLLGYSADEALGQSINLIVPTELRDEERTILERLRRGERIHHFETVRRRKDGRRIDISLTVSPVRDEEGRVIGASKVARDITQRKRSEEALRESRDREQERIRELDAVLRTTPVAIMIAHDPDCAMVTGNPTAHELLRLAEGENLSAASAAPDRLPFYEDRNGRRVRPEEMPLRIAASRGIEVRDVELDLVFEGGARRHVYGNAAPLRAEDGTPVGAVAALMDITALEEAQRALNEADRRKDEFLATLAHELRNPLAPIRNSLEILGRDDLAPERAEEARETIARQVSHMVRLVDDLLDVSRITRGNLRLRKTRVELEPLIRQTIETCRPLLDFARQTVEIFLPERPVYLEADAVRLTQVFGNLLQNACKYSEEGSNITIAAEVRGSRIAISVTDRGVGIPADKLDVIFEMFSQVGESAEETGGGLGIGLTLVKRLVELHGGVVSAHSEGQGRGSVFVVELPLAGAPATLQAPAPAPKRETPGTMKRRILVVDDNRDSVRSLATLLDIEGHEVFTAYDGLEAVEQAERVRPGVILLDVGLPGLNGLEACRRIREQPWGRDMVIVAITGWGQDSDRRRSQEAGFDHHLVKPIDVGFLLEQLGSSALNRKSGWIHGTTSRRQTVREATPES